MLDDRRGGPHFSGPCWTHTLSEYRAGLLPTNETHWRGRGHKTFVFGGGGKKKTKSPTLLNLNFYYVSLFISVRSLRGALIGPLILRLSLHSPAFSKCLNTCFMLYFADVWNFSKKAVGSKMFSSRRYCLVTPVSFLYSENTGSGTSSESLAAPFHTHSLRWLLLPYGGRPWSRLCRAYRNVYHIVFAQ